MRAPVCGTEIYFNIEGYAAESRVAASEAAPIVVLVHGGPGLDHSSGKRNHRNVGAQRQLLYFDHRGCGLSARGDRRRYTLDQNVEDMEALRRYLALGPIVTIGTSYGGMVAMAHAARYPESVAGMVLVSTASHFGYIERARSLVRSRGSAEQVAMCDALFAGEINTNDRFAQYLKVMAPLYSYCTRELISPCQPNSAVLEARALEVAYGAGGFLHTLDLRREMSQITAPTLVIAGQHDWIHAPEFSEEIARLIANARLHVFERSSHTVATDEPQRYFDVLMDFLNRERTQVSLTR